MMTGLTGDDVDGAGEGAPGVGTRYCIQCPWKRCGELGRGGTATVYKAIDSRGVLFAVKEIPWTCSCGKDVGSGRQIARIKEEISCSSGLTHENIIQYLGTEKRGDKQLIFMELAGQGSLKKVIESHGPLQESKMKVYLRHIVKALEYMHANHHVHLDLKCDNILVTDRGICKVADFGWAAKMRNEKMSSPSLRGSVFWSAPETFDCDTTYGYAADIWGVGCTVIEMATGKRPFPDLLWSHVLGLVGFGGGSPSIPDTLSDSCRDFISRCLQRNPERRSTAKELLDHPFLEEGETVPSTTVEVFAFEPPPGFLQPEIAAREGS